MSQLESTQTLQGIEFGYQDSIKSMTRTLDTKNTIRAIAITRSLILALLEDIQNNNHSTEIMFQDIGWLNKYNIHLRSSLSQKVIYRECGIIEMLVDLGVIEMKDSPTRWGQQKYHYRIAIDIIKDWLVIEL